MQTINRLVIVILLCLLPAAFYAQEEDFDDLFAELEAEIDAENGTADAGGEAESALELAGSHRVSIPFPLEESDWLFSSPLNLPVMENQLTLSYQDDAVSLTSNWQVDIAYTGADQPVPVLDARPGENYLAWKTERLTLSAGYQLFAWGYADGINPTNNLNPVDFTRGLQEEKLPAFSLSCLYYPLDNLALEAVYIPSARADKFPVAAADLIPATLFAPGEVTVQSLDFGLESVIVGTRVVYYHPVFDLAASYVFDYDSFYTPDIDVVSYPDKDLDLSLDRIHRIGLDTKFVAGSLGIWLEAALALPHGEVEHDYQRRGMQLAWTTGLDFNWGPEDLFYTNLQYTGRYVPGYYDTFYTDYPGGAPDPVSFATDPAYAEEYLYRALTDGLGNVTEGLYNGLIMNLDFSFLDGKISPVLNAACFLPALYDDTPGTRLLSLMLQPELGFSPLPALEISLSGNLAYAWIKTGDEIDFNDSDQIGMFRTQNGLSLSLEYSWDGNLMH